MASPGGSAPGAATATGSVAPAKGAGAATPSPKAATPTPTRPQTQPGAKKEPLRLGSVSTLSGPYGGTLRSALKAVQAWVADVNSRGGVNGHPVEYSIVDDGSDGSRNRALVQELVERRGVVAFLYANAALSGSASVAYIQEKKIPFIGTDGGSPWYQHHSMYFPQMPNDVYTGYAFAGATSTVALPLGKTKVALIYCSEAAACDATVNAKAFAKYGFEIVYSAKVSLAQPDFTAQCLAARNAGAQVAFIGLDRGSINRVADSCANVDFRPIYGWPTHSTADPQLKNPNLENAAIATITAPWFADAVPGVAEMRVAMTKYAPGTAIDGPAMFGWTAAKLVEKATRDLTEPTSAAVLKGLYTINNDDIGGITYPITFREGAPNNAESMQACWWAVQIKDGQWTLPEGIKRHCDKDVS